MHYGSLLSGGGLNRRSFVIAGISFIRLRLPSEHAKYFGPRFHCECLGSQRFSSSAIFSSSKCVPGSTSARKPAMETGCMTVASTLIHWNVFLSIQSSPSMPVNTLASVLGGLYPGGASP